MSNNRDSDLPIVTGGNPAEKRSRAINWHSSYLLYAATANMSCLVVFTQITQTEFSVLFTQLINQELQDSDVRQTQVETVNWT